MVAQPARRPARIRDLYGFTEDINSVRERVQDGSGWLFQERHSDYLGTHYAAKGDMNQHLDINFNILIDEEGSFYLRPE